jgi:hypothetical protein
MNKMCLLAFAERKVGYGSEDPDPYRDLTDLEHYVYKGSKANLYKCTANSGNNKFKANYENNLLKREIYIYTRTQYIVHNYCITFEVFPQNKPNYNKVVSLL